MPRVKVDKAIAGKTSMQMAEEFVNQPDSSAYWMQEVIGADGKFKAEEWQALGELGITDTDKFLKDFWDRVRQNRFVELDRYVERRRESNFRSR